MRRAIISLFLLLIGLPVLAQSLSKTSKSDDAQQVAEFRNFENSVKYTNPDSLFAYAHQFDTLNPNQKPYYQWAVGRALFWKGNFPDSYSVLEKALESVEKKPNQILQAEILLDLAASLSMMEYTGKALSLLLVSNQIFESEGTAEQRARAGVALAELYRKIADFPKALQTLEKILPYARQHKRTMAMYYHRKAAIHTELNHPDSTLYFSNKALQLSTELKDPVLMAISENEIGYILRVQGKIEEALPHFYRADSMWQSAGMYRFAVNAMHHISICYGVLEKFDARIKINSKAYDLIKDKQWYQIEVNIYEDFRDLYRQIGKPDSALYFETKRLEAMISWRDQQHSMNTRMVEAMYNQKQNEDLIEKQKLELQNRLQLEKTIKNDRIYLMVISIGLLLFAGALGYIAYLQKKKRENSLREQKNIMTQKEKLEQALSENQALLQELHHRIKNNLQQISTLIDMQLRTVTEEQGKSVLRDAHRRISAMGTVHEMLYSYENLSNLHVNQFLSTLINNIKDLHIQGEALPVDIELDLEDISLNPSDAIALGMIISEAVSNSIKHRKENSKTQIHVSVKSDPSSETIISCVADNNHGDPEDLKKKRQARLGIRLMEIFTQKLNGTIHFVQGQNGLIVELKFPKT
jgi:two-component sensor histidine kinase